MKFIDLPIGARFRAWLRPIRDFSVQEWEKVEPVPHAYPGSLNARMVCANPLRIVYARFAAVDTVTMEMRDAV